MDGHEFAWLRYSMTGFFAAFGAFMLLRGRGLGSAATYFRFRVANDVEGRFEAAYLRRQCDESLPSSQMGASIGCTAFALALATAVTRVSLGVLYASLALALAAVLTVAYLRLNVERARRYASLDVRDPAAVAPSYTWALAAIATVTPLLWLPFDPAVALLATASGVFILALANRVSAMPAFLHGSDPAVERFVDVRLREGRTAQLIALAVAPGYVFEAFAATVFSSMPCLVAVLFGLVAVLVTNARLVVLMRTRPSASEISTWRRAAI